jgi:hypothetical protein
MGCMKHGKGDDYRATFMRGEGYSGTVGEIVDRMDYGNGQDMSDRKEGKKDSRRWPARKGVPCLNDKKTGGGSAGVNCKVRKFVCVYEEKIKPQNNIENIHS